MSNNLKSSALSAIRRRGWPTWVALLLVIILIVEIILICGSSSLFNLVIPLVADLEQPRNPTTSLNAVNSLAFSPDQVILTTGSGDGVVRFWQMIDGSLMRALKVSDRPISSMAFSPDGSTLAVGDWHGRATLWQADSGLLQNELTFDSAVRAVAYHPSKMQVALGLLNGEIYLWSPQVAGQPLAVTGHTDAISRLVYLPDGNMLVSAASDGSVRLWHAEDGTLQNILATDVPNVLDLEISPDGLLLASASFDAGLSFWRMPGGEYVNTLPFETPIWNIAFAHDGQWLAASSQGFMDIWQVSDNAITKTTKSQRQNRSILPDTTALLSLDFAKNDNLLAVGSRDGRVILWQLNSDGSLQIVKDWLVE